MKNIKRIVFLSFFFVFCFSFCVSCFGQEVTLKELIYSDSQHFYAYRLNASGSQINADYTWINDSTIRISNNSITSVPFAFGLSTLNSVGDERYKGSGGDILILNLPEFYLTYSPQDVFDNSLETFYEFIIYYYDTSNSYKELDRISGRADRYRDWGNGSVSYYFSLDYSLILPYDFARVDGFDIRIHTNSTSNAAPFTFGHSSKPINFYIGSKENAPIYSGADDSNQNDLDSKEQVIRNTTDQGFTEWNSTFDIFKSTLAYTSDFMLGASWITNNILNPFLNRTPLGSFLLLSLVFGIFIFLLGSVGFVISKVASNRHNDAMVSRSERRRYKR